MNQADQLKALAGIIGTASSAALADMETAAAIFAGVSTGLFMLVSTAVKIRKKK